MAIEDDTEETEHDLVKATQHWNQKKQKETSIQQSCSYFHKCNHGVSNCYQKERDEEYQRNRMQRSRTTQQSLVQYFQSEPCKSQGTGHDNQNEKFLQR